jgi:hypothetical protein
MGIKTLTTATLVPIGLILSKDYVETLLMKEQTGGFVDGELPIFDNKLVGTYLKLAGLSVLDLSPATLLPLGTVMIIYDLAIKNMTGGALTEPFNYNSQRAGARSPFGSDIPPGFFQKIDQAVRGQNMPEPIVHILRKMPETNNNLQQECMSGNCNANVYTSVDPTNTPKFYVKGFPALGINSTHSNDKWSGQLLEYNLPKLPAAMAGGARQNKKRSNRKNNRQQKGSGSDWMAVQYSRGPVNSPTMNKNRFRAFNKTDMLIDNSNFTGKNMANNSPLIVDTPLFKQNHPSSGVATSQFAGKLEPNELFAERKVGYGVATSQFGGSQKEFVINEMQNNIEDKHQRKKLVTCLTNTCKKYNMMSEQQSKELRRQSRDNRYNTENILRKFPLSVLENELQKRHAH